MTTIQNVFPKYGPSGNATSFLQASLAAGNQMKLDTKVFDDMRAQKNHEALLAIQQGQESRAQGEYERKLADRAGAIQAVQQGKTAAMSNNPLADAVIASQYSKAGSPEAFTENLMNQLGGVKDETGYYNVPEDRLQQLNTAFEGSKKEQATRLRDEIYNRSMQNGLDPITASQLADAEYNRAYGAQAGAEAASLAEQQKIDFDMYKAQLEYGLGKPKAGAENTININSGGAMGGGTGMGTNSSSAGTTQTRDLDSLKTSLKNMYTGKAGGDYLSIFSGAPDADVLDKFAAVVLSDNDVTNEQALKALELINTGIDDRILSGDKRPVGYDLSNPKDQARLIELAKSTGTESRDLRSAQNQKNAGMVGENAQSLERLRMLDEITNQYNQVQQARALQNNPAGTNEMFSDIFGSKDREASMKKQQETLDKQISLQDKAAKINTNIKSIPGVPDSLYSAEGLVNKTYMDGKYYSVGMGYNLGKSREEITNTFTKAGISKEKVELALLNPKDLELTDEEAISLAQVSTNEYIEKLDNIVLSKMGGKRFDDLSPQMQAIGLQMMFRGDLGQTEYGKQLKSFIAKDDVQGIYNYIEGNADKIPKEVVDRISKNLAYPNTKPLRMTEEDKSKSIQALYAEKKEELPGSENKDREFTVQSLQDSISQPKSKEEKQDQARRYEYFKKNLDETKGLGVEIVGAGAAAKFAGTAFGKFIGVGKGLVDLGMVQKSLKMDDKAMEKFSKLATWDKLAKANPSNTQGLSRTYGNGRVTSQKELEILKERAIELRNKPSLDNMSATELRVIQEMLKAK